MKISTWIRGFSSAFIAFSAVQASALTWATHNASAQGSGCNTNGNIGPVDVSFLANGSDVSVIFTSMDISLTDHTQGLRGQKNCNMRIPFLLPQGSYEGELSESVVIGIMKSSGADAKLDFRSRIIDSLRSGNPGGFKQLNRSFGRGTQVYEPLLVQSRSTAVGRMPGARQCDFTRNAMNQHAPFYYDAQLLLSASRQNTSQSVLVQSDSLDVRLDMSQRLRRCGGGPVPPPVVTPIPTPRPPVPTPRPPVPPPSSLRECSLPMQTVNAARGGTYGMGQPGERLYAALNIPNIPGMVDVRLTRTEYHDYRNIDPYNLQWHVGHSVQQLSFHSTGTHPTQWMAASPGTQMMVSTMITARPNNNAESQYFTLNAYLSYRTYGMCQ